jgi:hypothetical protein
LSTGSCNDDGLLEYQRMADALAQVKQSTGTRFVLSLCEWGPGMMSLESLFLGSNNFVDDYFKVQSGCEFSLTPIPPFSPSQFITFI